MHPRGALVVMEAGRRIGTVAALLGAALLTVVPGAMAGSGIHHDIYDTMFDPFCGECHNKGRNDVGNLTFDIDRAECGSECALPFCQQFSNGNVKEAKYSDKPLVHPYQPWNSFILDKMRGTLVTEGEGEPMPPGTPGLVAYCPGGIDELARWIFDGAQCRQNDPPAWDKTPFFVVCPKPQPRFELAPAGGDTLRVRNDTFELVPGEREKEEVTEVALGNDDQSLFARSISLHVAAGTEWATVTRKGDAAPLIVARMTAAQDLFYYVPSTPSGVQTKHRTVTIDLPEGVAVELPAGTVLEIRQRVRNEYWITGENWTFGQPLEENRSAGMAAVDFRLVDAGDVVATAEPILDTTGTELLFVPPRAAAATGGHWLPDGLTDAALGIWTDQHANPTGTSILAGTTRSAGEAVTSGYASFNLNLESAPAGVVYECLHANGASERIPEDTIATETSRTTGALSANVAMVARAPLRLGCSDGSSGGAPVLAGGSPAPECSRQNENVGHDCGADGACEAADLVGGSSSQDGRCALIGLAW